jgi:hypothetical protein
MSSTLREFNLGNVKGFIDSDSGQLRYLRVGPEELLRGIYGSVRRPDWGTVVPKTTGFKLETKRDSFTCTFIAHHKDEIMDFTWNGKITGKLVDESHVEIEYEFEGTPERDTMTNRLGLCLLHPASLQGKKVEIEHNKESCEMMEFPTFIKPDQPFKDTKAISYEVKKGIGIRVELYGDGFETEDQRNYGDASYKTYCHPQEWGSPYKAAQGKLIHHRAKLIISTSGYDGETAIPQETSGQLSSLGTLFTRKMAVHEMEPLLKMGFTHAQATTEGVGPAKLIGGPVYLQTQIATVPVDFSPNDGVLFSPSRDWQKLNNTRGAKTFIQTKGWFIEMNGSRPHFDEIDGAALGLQPKTHQFDTETMMECAWVIPDQAATARHIGAKSIIVGPIRLSDMPDERTNGIEAPLFALAAVVNSVKAKVDCLTLFDADTLLKSPAALVLHLLSKRTSNTIRAWDVEPELVMIECGHLILANLSWEPSENFKKVPFDATDNLKTGIKGEYHLFNKDNISDWREVLAKPAKHGNLSAIPPRTIVVLG